MISKDPLDYSTIRILEFAFGKEIFLNSFWCTCGKCKNWTQKKWLCSSWNFEFSHFSYRIAFLPKYKILNISKAKYFRPGECV